MNQSSGDPPGNPAATPRPDTYGTKSADRWALSAVAVIATGLVVYAFDARWFVDDAMITMQYARNVATGCGWSFNCGANDFATTSFLHTFLSSIAFHIATEPDTGLVLVKVYESTVIVLAVIAFCHMLIGAGIARFAAVLAAVGLCANHNTFQYMSSGMENALYLLALSLTFRMGFRGRHALVGGLTGVCHLVRPEAVFAGPAIALVDLLRRKSNGRIEIRRCLRDWTKAGMWSLAVAAPVWLVFTVLKGTPVPVSGEVKLLTAGNWGLFHEMIWPLISREIGWLPFVLAGFAVAAYRRSALLGPLLTATALVLLYSVVGLPKSPWYYLPLHFGFFAAAAAGIDLLARAVGGYRSWLAPACHVAIAGILVSPLVDLLDRFSRTARTISATADRRHDVNKRTGEWLNRNTPPDSRVAIPNIGYIGFHGGVRLVDLVGLVTPDIARNRKKGGGYWYHTYRPELYGNKIRWSPHFDDGRYELVAVLGKPTHRLERYMIWLRRDLATARVRRSWTVPGSGFRIAARGGIPVAAKSAGGALRIEIPSEAASSVELTSRLDGAALLDERFPASDLVVDVTHELPKVAVRSLAVTLESDSESGPGHALFLMKRGFQPGRRQHSLLSQENVVDESNFNPGNVVRLRLEYTFRGTSGDSARLSLEKLELVSFSGCRLAGNCISRIWE